MGNNRGQASIHINEQILNNNSYDEISGNMVDNIGSSSSPDNHFYNFMPASEYDGGFFFSELGHNGNGGGAGNVDLNVF
jgi:hypothetical protein